MILPRTTLFHTPSASTSTTPQSQPQSQPPPPSSESWSFTTSLPVSYRVAIFLDASILLLTIAILLGAILYIRNRRPAPRSFPRKDLRITTPIIKVKSPGAGSSGGEEQEGLLYHDLKTPQMSEMPTTPLSGILSPGLGPGAGNTEKRKKKGHVRWTPSVEGGEAFGIPGRNNLYVKGKDGNGDTSACNCRGRRHTGCWRFEVYFQEGMKAAEGRKQALGSSMVRGN